MASLTRFQWRRTLLAVATTAAFAGATVRAAHAHFILTAPACYSRQDALGSPQKSGPCGQADPGSPAVPTGAVTAYARGGMITLTINETITHPGHYRVAIARDMASLPPDPPVMAGSTACGSTTIERSPTLPLLADGLLVHTAAFSGPQTVQIPLPADFTCENCVLQVSEFMSQHGLNNPGGCFYHHCAMVTVGAATTDGGAADASATDSAVADTSVATDAATADSAPQDAEVHEHDAGVVADSAVVVDASTMTPARNGCGCKIAGVGGASRASLASIGLAIAMLMARRRR